MRKNEGSMSDFKQKSGPKFNDILNEFYKTNSEKSGTLYNLEKILQVMESGADDYSKELSTKNLNKKTTTLGDYDIFKDRKDGGRFLEMFFSELQRAISDVKDKSEIATNSTATLRKMEHNLLESLHFFKKEARDYEKLCKVVDRQLSEMEEKLKEDEMQRTLTCKKQEELNLDINAESEFYKTVITRKNEIKTNNAEELRDTVHEYSNIQKKLNKCRAEFKEDQKLIETLDREINQKQQAKLESSHLYEALDIFDKMALVFLYGKTDEYDLEVLASEQQLVQTRNPPSTGRINIYIK